MYPSLLCVGNTHLSLTGLELETLCKGSSSVTASGQIGKLTLRGGFGPWWFQVDAGLTFNKKDLEHSFIFDIKTIDRVFYLVADTEDEMNKWVRCICDICGFNPTDDGKAQTPNR